MKKLFGRKAFLKTIISLCCVLLLAASFLMRSLPAAASSDESLWQQETSPALDGETLETLLSDESYPSPTPETAQEPVSPPEQTPAPDLAEVENPEDSGSAPSDIQEETEAVPSPPSSETPEVIQPEQETEVQPEQEAEVQPEQEVEVVPEGETEAPPEQEIMGQPEETLEVELPTMPMETEVPLETQNISLELGLANTPVLIAGEQIDIPLSLLVYLGEQIFATRNGVLDGRALAYDPMATAADYDQSLTQYVSEMTLSLLGRVPEGLSLDWSATTLAGGIVQGGENQGYALLRVAIGAGATPGTYTLPLRISYTLVGAEGPQEANLDLSLRVEELLADTTTFTLVPGRTDAVIVTTHAGLRDALKTNLYSTIYLGYTEENQGVIAYGDAAGLPINRDMVIDGTDPLSGHRMQLVDYPGSGSLDGLYANASGLTITVQNVDITGNNYYGVMYGTGKTNIALHFRNVNYHGRQIAHNVGANSVVTFTDCVVEIANMSTGTSHEVLEAPSVTFYGSNDVTRTGPETNSMFYIYGTGDKTLTIAPGASVRMQTTDYMIYTDNPAQMSLLVYGSLRLTTTGSRGSATYLDLYLGQLAIYPEGSLTIDHQSTQRPTLRVLNLNVQGNLRLTRQGSTLPVLGIESGGSATFDNPRSVVLENPSGALIRSVAGSPKMTISTQVINRYQSSNLTGVWNNIDLSPFTTNWTLAIGGGSLTDVSGLEPGNSGVAIGAAAITSMPPSLMSDTSLRFGRTTLALNQVGGGERNVTGAAVSGATVEIKEYVYGAAQGLGNLLQGRITQASGGAFTLADQPLDNPITFPGSRVYAIGNDGTLVAHTYTDPTITGPVFLEVPESLPFETARLSGQDQLIHRIQEDWRMVVYDPRQSGEGFQLYAQMTSPFATAAGDVLEGGLVLATGQTVMPLGEEALLLARGDTGDGLDTYAISWTADQGLLARLPAFEGVPSAPYEATITFTLTQGP